jgi:hypothetical protein
MFLVIVLIAGTFALSNASLFIIKGMNAQVQPYYGMDIYDKPYGKDNRDKSKDNVNVNKIKCINDNININGENAGDINASNKGLASPGSSFGYDGRYYNDGYNNINKQNKDFDCIINNNNNNTNVAGGGQPPIPPINVTCEECFAQVLNATAFASLELALERGDIDVFVGTTLVEINSLAELCDILENVSGTIIVSVVTQILRTLGIILTPGDFFELITCIGTALGITIPSILGPIMR